MTYRRMLKEGLQHARIDTLVGAPPAPPGLAGDDEPAAPRTFWAALFSQPSQMSQRRGRTAAGSDSGETRRVAL